MWRAAVFWMLVMIAEPSSVWADPATDCGQDEDQDRSIRGCTELIRQDSHDAVAYTNRGAAYGQRGEIDRAIADFSKAVQINPKLTDAHYNLGAAHLQKGEINRAIADFTKAIETNPKSARAYLYRCRIYADRKRHERVISDCTKAIELDPELVLAYHVRAASYQSKGDLELALLDYDEALRRDPEYVAALAGRILVREEAHSACTQVQDRARRIRGCSVIIRSSRGGATPILAMAHLERGLAYRDQGMRAESIADLKRAIEIEPDPASARGRELMDRAQKALGTSIRN